MFLHGDEYSREVKALFASDEPIDAAIAFWGEGAAEAALSKQGAPRRIVCNLGSGGTKPGVIRSLMDSDGVEVKTLDVLHAKVVIGKNIAIIGSANFSANGLGLEDGELAHWEEAGYVVTDPADLNAIRGWFKRLWTTRSRKITNDDLDAAEEAWSLNRNGRPISRPKSGRFMVDAANWKQFADRNIWVIVWGRRPNLQERKAEAKDRGERVAAIAKASGRARRTIRLPLDYYHDWDDHLSDDLDAVFIDVQRLANSPTCKCHGVRRPMATGHVITRHGAPMDVLERMSALEGLKFGAPEKEAFSKMMNELPTSWFESHGTADTPSFVISLDEVLHARYGD